MSEEVAQRTLMKYQISSTLARQIVDACVDFARNQQGGPGNYAIFVLAPNGDILDAHVMDGVVPIGVETGLLKAKTALYARTPSSAVAPRFPTLEGRVIRTRSRQGIRASPTTSSAAGADRRGEPADRRHWRRRRQHGRAVRLSRSEEGARSSASAATSASRRRTRPSGRRAPGRAHCRG